MANWRSRSEDALHEELQFHLEAQVERNRAAGMPEVEARRAAQRQFGRLVRVKEACREAVGWRWLRELRQDLRFAWRLARREPGFTATTVLTLGLCLGATLAIGSLVATLLLRPLPVRAPEQLAIVWETNPERQVTQFSVSYPNLRDWSERTRRWAGLAAFDQRALNFAGTERPERVVGEYQTANLLPLLGVEVALGRHFLPGEDAANGPRLAILSDTFWRRSFGADPAVIGRPIRIEGNPHTVIGVLPPRAGLSREIDVILPLGPLIQSDRTDHGLNVLGRIRATTTLPQAEAELQAIAAQLESEYPEENRGWSVRVQSLSDWITPAPLRRLLWLLLLAVALLLTVGCANVGGLLLVRTARRSRELAIRAALGGGRGRLGRQLVTESLLLSLAGGILGLGLAAAILVFLRDTPGIDLPRLQELSVTAPLAFGAFVLAIGAGGAAGLLPVITHGRAELNPMLKQGGAARVWSGRLRQGLPIVQLALATLVLALAITMWRSLQQLRGAELGYSPDSVLTVRVAPQQERVRFFEQLVQRVQSLPGVQAVGLTNSAPMSELNTSLHVFPVGRSVLAAEQSLQAEWRIVNEDYFRAVGIPVRSGRGFESQDRAAGVRAVIVSETLARQLWGTDEPIGRQINPGGGTRYRTVIGVVGDVRSHDPAVPPVATYYLPVHEWVWGHMTLLVRAEGDVRRLVPLIQQEVQALDPELPLFDVSELQGLIDRRLANKEMVTVLLGGFSLFAAGLSAIALYGLVAYETGLRRHEFGIRLALGARPAQILRPALKGTLTMIMVGLVAGTALTATGSVLMKWWWPGAETVDSRSAFGALALLAIVAGAAAFLPARRAARVDPIVALRSH